MFKRCVKCRNHIRNGSIIVDGKKLYRICEDCTKLFEEENPEDVKKFMRFRRESDVAKSIRYAKERLPEGKTVWDLLDQVLM